MKLSGVFARPTVVLMAGRAVGFAGAFLIPVVLVRVFAQADLGTYKQLLLIHATLYVVAQVGMAESLYYFLPRHPREAGGYAANALLVLCATGLLCLAVLHVAGPAIGAWLNNPDLAAHMTVLGLFLGLSLASAPLEMALVARKRYVAAGVSYAVTDLLRTALFIAPAFLARSLEGMLWGAVASAAIRLLAAGVWLRHEFAATLRPDAAALRRQLVYALPFAAAVVVELLQATYHQWAVSYRFDAAAFALYAVGCLSIPVVDLVANPAGNVMMVRMGEALAAGRPGDVLEVWHDTTRKLALLFVPLVVLLMVTARELFLLLFTAAYLPSVPIFIVWTIGTVWAVFVTDGVLRVYADTRFLFTLNAVRLGLNVALMAWFIGRFGLRGAVLVTVIAAGATRALALARMKRLMQVRLARLLPWRALAAVTAAATLAVLPAWAVKSRLTLPLLPVLFVTGVVYAGTYGALMAALGGRMTRLFQDALSRWIAYPIVLRWRDREVRQAGRLAPAKHAVHFQDPSVHRPAQEARLRALLRHCAEHVPYYRGVFRERRFDPSAPDAMARFAELPLLTKDVLTERASALRSRASGTTRVFPNASGGSTGKMVSFQQDQHYRDHFLASLWASNEVQGWRRGARTAVLWGAPRDVAELRRPRARLRMYLENTRFFDAFDMTPRRMEACHRSLTEFRPEVIVAYASSIHLFASYLAARGVECRYPSVSIISSAEMLTAEMRRQIGRAFPVPVFDRYGSREVGVIGTECEAHDGLHVNVSDLYLECVDAAGDPVPEGTAGELAVTVLTNQVMPFVRYRIEDRGVLTTRPCACGRRSPRILKLLGRSSDVIVGLGGRLVHGEYFTHLFYGLAQIRQFQFVQESLDTFRLLVVPGQGFEMEMTRPLEREMRDVLGERARVTWDVVPRIPPLPSGKHRFTVSHLTGVAEEGSL